MKQQKLLKALALLVCLVCLQTASAYDFYSGGIYYNITGSNTVEVTYDSGYNSYSGYVKIPRSLTRNGAAYTVTAIGKNAFYNSSALTSVSIPNTVTMIKDGGISSNSLTRVIIPNSVAIIDQNAFCNCGYLTDIIIGSGVTYFGDHAFGFGEYEGDFTPPTQKVLCTASTPPVFGYMYGADDSEYSSDNELWNAFWTRKSLYVPNNSLGRYYTATGWRLFSDIDSESVYYSKSILDDGSLGSINFYNSGDYPWFINNTDGESYAQSGNAGATSSTSTLAAKITIQEDAILSFDFKAWGEGASYDKCIFTVDGVTQFSYGARDNDWEYSGIELSAGTHTVTWSFDKDGSVDGTGDFFAIDHVKVRKKAPEAYACYTSSNTTLTFYYDDLRSTRQGTTYDMNTGHNDPDWRTTSVYSSVTRVVFDPSFADARPTSTVSWFANMESLLNISGMEYLNTSEVIDMTYMFGDCGMKSLDLSSFNTAKVTSMAAMFAFSGGLTSLDVSGFNTANVTQMSFMFSDCSGLKSLDLSKFNTSEVTAMDYMFDGCSDLTTIYGGSKWSTAAVTTSNDMFKDCTSLVGGQGTTYDANHVDKAYAHIDGGTADLGYFSAGKEAYACYTSSDSTLTFYYDNQWYDRAGTTYALNEGENEPGWQTDGLNDDVSRVVFDPSFADARPTSTYDWFGAMFYLDNFVGLSYLNTSEVTTMRSMFSDCYGVLTADLSGFDTRNVSDMTAMFAFCLAEELDLSSFSTENVTNMAGMFAYCSSLKTIYVSDTWSTSNVTSSGYMFSGCTTLVGGKGTTFDENHVDKAYAHIDGGPSNPGYLTDINEAYACYTPENSTLTFYCDNQRSSRPGTTYDLNEGDTYPAWYTDGTTHLQVTAVVFDPSFADVRPTSTFRWFATMPKLLNITGMSEYLNTSQVTHMGSMFVGDYRLESLDVSNFNTSKVTNMSQMFYGCTGLTSLDLSSFNTANVTVMAYMFYNDSTLTTITVGDEWSTSAVSSSFGMFLKCKRLVGGQGTTYDADHTNVDYAHIDGGPSNPGYFTQGSKHGDVNGDGNVNISDVTSLINYLLTDNNRTSSCDVNGDGFVNISDVTTLINYLLTDSWSD